MFRKTETALPIALGGLRLCSEAFRGGITVLSSGASCRFSFCAARDYELTCAGIPMNEESFDGTLRSRDQLFRARLRHPKSSCRIIHRRKLGIDSDRLCHLDTL